MKILKLFALLTIALGLILNFGGCSKNSSPFAPESENVSSPNDLEFISFGEENGSLEKENVFKVSEYMTPEDGGKLEIEYSGRGNINVKTTFEVLPGALNEGEEISMRTFRFVFLYIFQPHGLVFNKSALLNIEITNADLTDIDPSRLGLYYINIETRKWEKMNVKEIIVDKENGYLKIVDGEIPHFSRYALAHCR